MKVEEISKEFEVGEAWWLAYSTFGQYSYSGTSHDFSLCWRFTIDTMNEDIALVEVAMYVCFT